MRMLIAKTSLKLMNGPTPYSLTKAGCAEPISISRSVINTMSMVPFVTALPMVYQDRDYDNWIDTLTEASTRLDVLQTAVTELRHLCESEDVLYSEQVLKLLASHGAITT